MTGIIWLHIEVPLVFIHRPMSTGLLLMAWHQIHARPSATMMLTWLWRGQVRFILWIICLQDVWCPNWPDVSGDVIFVSISHFIDYRHLLFFHQYKHFIYILTSNWSKKYEWIEYHFAGWFVMPCIFLFSIWVIAWELIHIFVSIQHQRQNH